jgi:sugar lactone lactonase YvrE
VKNLIGIGVIAFGLLGFLTPQASAATLGTTNITLSAPAGSDTLELAVTAASPSWSASANANWLHLSASGIGNAFLTFTYDVNLSTASRTGTLTVAGQTVTVNQLGTGYVPAQTGIVTVVGGFSDPGGIALDSAGNVYIADTDNNAVKKWNASTFGVSTLASSLSIPYNVTVDGSGNVYIANTFGGNIKKWIAATGTVTNLVSVSGKAVGLTTDSSNNLYYSDIVVNDIKERQASDGAVHTVVSGYNQPYAIARDVLGNFYVADANNHGISRYTPGSGITPIVGGLNFPEGVAVDGEGNVYYSDTATLSKLVVANNSVVTLANSGISALGIAIDPVGNVFFADSSSGSVKEWVHAFVDTTPHTVGFAAGTDSLPQVFPTGFNLLPRFAPATDQPWLTIAGVTNGVVTVVFTRNVGPTRTGHVKILGVSLPVVQYGVSFGFTSLTEGSDAGSDSVALGLNPGSAAWSATANVSWLHIASGSQSGFGSANIIFNFDTNSGPTRTGTMTISGETVAITQAGSSYVPVSPLVTIVSNGLNQPSGLAVDGSGAVFIADRGNNAIKKWDPATGLTTSLGIGGLLNPNNVALDSSKNVYIVDTSHNAVKEWLAASQTVTNLVANNLALPEGLAVDGVGNVYISDSGHNAIKKWAPDTGLLTSLVSSGTTNPAGVAVDIAGNVYFADGANPVIKKWSVTLGTASSLASIGFNPDYGVAVDGGGNVYFADYADASVFGWSPSRAGLFVVHIGGFSLNLGVAVDAAENVYISELGQNTVKEIPRAFVDAAPRAEGTGGGGDTLAVLPASVNLQGPFAPSSDQPWLTINSISGGVIHFMLSPNNGAGRTAHLNILGQSVEISQPGVVLGTTSLTLAPTAGSNSVVLGIDPPSATWTASANAPWLHMNPASQSGAGNTNIVFGFDPNPGLTRTGTLTIAGFTVTVTQAGGGYVAAPEPATPLVASGISLPYGLALDGAGNVYIADTFNNVIKKWTVTNNTVSTLVSTGLNNPNAVAVDANGNVYIADTGNNVVKEWFAATQSVSNLVSGLNNPEGVAVDASGNVFISDFGNNAIKKRSAADGSVSSLPVLAAGPHGIAVDAAGNIYYGEDGFNEVHCYRPSKADELILIQSDLSLASGVAVDGSGNVYVADGFNNAIKKWSAATGQVTTIISSNLSSSFGVAADSAGNVYVANTGPSTILELPAAYVQARPVTISAAAAAAFALPPLLPTNENLLPPFAAVSNQPWLNVTGVGNGTVQLTAPFNDSGAARQANVTLLGVPISVTQRNPFLSVITNLLEGPAAGFDSVALQVNPDGQSWTVAANAPWLHLVTTNQGTGSTNIIFSYDSNPGATRAGTLTTGNLTVTVMQAPSTYVAAPSPGAAVITGLSFATGVAVDSAGNVYGNDQQAIHEWNRTNNSVTTLVSGSGISGLGIDTDGNLYFGNYVSLTLSKWTASTHAVSVLTSGLTDPAAVAVDSVGNIYIGNGDAFNVLEWSVLDGSLSTLISGAPYPDALAFDGADNLYVSVNGVINRRSAETGALQPIITGSYTGVAVDGSGGIYFGDIVHHTVDELSPVTGGVLNLYGGLNNVGQVAVDAAKNVYAVNPSPGQIRVFQRAFVDSSPVIVSADAGTGTLSPVLPATVCLIGPFAPTNDSPWLTVTGATNGIVNFAFTAASSRRTGHIQVLGENIAVTQDLPLCATTNLVEGPSAGSDSVVVATLSPGTPWSAAAVAPWLHVTPAFQTNSGSADMVFSFDANPGPIRVGTLSIAGQTIDVTQAGSTYVRAPGPLTPLVSSGLVLPYGLAVDASGNVYIADTYNNAIKKWNPANNSISNLNIVGLNNPQGVAVDTNGNVYIADTGNNLVRKWSAATGLVTTNISGLAGPSCLALDFAGNIYFAETGASDLRTWSVSNGNLTTLIPDGLSAPSGVAVDSSGNVYVADTFNSVIKIWSPANGTTTTVIASNLSSCFGVAVDSIGNVYVADTGHSAIRELPRVFLDPATRAESPATGSDNLPVVLPSTENLLPPFGPSSDQSWLTLTGATNGVISFAFSSTTSNRTAYINVFGQAIPVTQTVSLPNPGKFTGVILGNGVFQLSFTNSNDTDPFTVLMATNLALPLSNWIVLGSATNVSTGIFQFDDPVKTNQTRFYRVRSP